MVAWFTTPNCLRGRRVAVGLLLFSLFQCFLTTGVVFGWPSLLLILKNDGVYESRCEANLPNCSDREVAFNLVYSLGAMMNVLGLTVAGWIPNPKISMVIGLLLTAVGSLMLGLTPGSNEWVWPIAFSLHGWAGGMAQMPCYSLGNAFGTGKGFVIACYVSVYCASALMYQIMLLIYRAGLSREQILICHASLTILCAVVSSWSWPSRPVKVGDILRMQGWRVELVTVDIDGDTSLETRSVGTKKGNLRKVMQAALSFRYISFLTFYLIELWFARGLVGYFAPMIDWKNTRLIERTGHGLDIDKHVSVFALMNALIGSTAIPFFGWIVARYGHRTAPFVMTALLGVVVIGAFLLPEEWPLYVMYVASGWHRQFVLSTYYNFVASEFTVEVFGRLAGLGTLASAGSGLTQWPVLEYTLNGLEGNFAPLFVVLLIIGVVLLILAILGFLQEQCCPSCLGCQKGSAYEHDPKASDASGSTDTPKQIDSDQTLACQHRPTADGNTTLDDSDLEGNNRREDDDNIDRISPRNGGLLGPAVATWEPQAAM
mmetsp:Transcript_46725/g.99977  ORF Transcript_46725/g.99977 Transcript_46725/m.99977 type:complete len:544 (+) Transcript_46725:210-1841(+)